MVVAFLTLPLPITPNKIEYVDLVSRATIKRVPDFDKEVLEPLRARQEKARLESLERTKEAEALQSTYTNQTLILAQQNQAQWLLKLRLCESGGDYSTNTGNGYYGAYQFSPSTWNYWQTGYARADLAPPNVQDEAIIKNTLAASGGLASQNPGCYRSQGLSAFPPTQ